MSTKFATFFGGRDAEGHPGSPLASLALALLAPFAAHPETAQMMILNPLSGRGLSGLFSTHPATEERVLRLRALARSA